MKYLAYLFAALGITFTAILLLGYLTIEVGGFIKETFKISKLLSPEGNGDIKLKLALKKPTP